MQTPSRTTPQNPGARALLARPSRALATLAVLALSALFTGTAGASSAQSAKPDQLVIRRGTGATRSLSGELTKYSLDGVTLDTGGRTQRFDANEVVRATFGDVPKNYAEAVIYAGRSEWESAAARFKLVAGDAGARDLVRASSRLRLAEALMRLGTHDSNFFAEAQDAAAKFIADYADNLEVPLARGVQARAMLLTGDAAGAAELYTALASELQNGVPTPGYDLESTASAGLAAARAWVAAGDTIKAREAFAAAKTNLTTAVTNAEDEELKARLGRLLDRADLGEGWVLLASDNASGARTFFEGELNRNPDGSSAQRFGALLGLGEALLAEGETTRAQLALAKVAALDPVDRDRSARAQIGLARCALANTGDPKSREHARTAAQTVLDRYGDTPSLAAAQELLSTLK